MAKVYIESAKQRGLTVSVLAKILPDPVTDLVSKTQPVKPKGSEVYVSGFYFPAREKRLCQG